jgi:inosose dehydratase
MRALLDRMAGAPITWGVCEVPGWGLQLPPERVLAEMSQIGLHATELGPEGYLPGDPARLRTMLERHGLTLVAGFLPAVLHAPDRLDDELARLATHAELLADAGASVLVLAAARARAPAAVPARRPASVAPDDGERGGYDASPELTAAEWKVLLRALDRADAIAADRGIALALHPHLGTAVVTPEHVDRVLDGSIAGLCLDTGHLTAGGGDPVALARSAASRVAHVHLKDVDTTWAEPVRTGRVAYEDAVRAGMYRPLGRGDLDVRALVQELEAGGYGGWYVLEQDMILEATPEEGGGPRLDAEASLAMLRRLASSVDADLPATGAGRPRAAREATSLRRGEG